MNKRQLDKQEKEKTIKGMKTIQDRIDRIEKSIKFNKLTMEFQKAQDIYQEAIKPYLVEKKNEENKKIMDALTQNLAMEIDTLKNLQKQLDDGVEVK